MLCGKSQLRAEIVTVGEELLSGRTVNTNASWIACSLRGLGIRVVRITTVGDDVDEIASAIREALARADIIVTSGGLGPTPDDLTLEGIARGLGRGLRLNEEALELVKKRYKAMVRRGLVAKVSLTKARTKMATLPEGSKPLPNPVGTALGVVLEREGKLIVGLPGVPAEMKAIFKESVIPLLQARVSRAIPECELTARLAGILESDLAPLLEKVLRRYPDVYVKSHPKGCEAESRIDLYVRATGETKDEARRRAEKVLSFLKNLIVERGGRAECT